MRHCKKRIWYILSFSILFSVFLMIPSKSVSAAGDMGKIHFITLPDNTDAILLECNGKFGMVDSGEDTDYPTGKDSRYPFRNGIVMTAGYEKDVISYMYSVGVTQDNFEFYIGTHTHSDHIGSADEVIYEFHPKRVYIEPYSDSDIIANNRLWDNLYNYDRMITAAKDTGATLIQSFKSGAPLYPETVTVTGTILWHDTTETTESDSETTDIDEETEEETIPEASIPPSDLSVTLTYQTDDTDTDVPSSVTLTTEDGSIQKEDENTWIYEFNGIAKYDDSKTPYSYTITPEASGYQFQPVNTEDNSNYDFICTPSDAELSQESVENAIIQEKPDTLSDSGITDETLSSPATSSTDSLITSSILTCDLVDPNSPADPTNLQADESAASGRSGIYEGRFGSSSSPSFYLGGKDGLLIEIMNYGVPRPQPDANYFSLGVKVTSISTGKTAFLSSDINNYLGTETVLAKKLGHVDILKLGHHGSYGSNTPTYINSLSPSIAILTGTYGYVTTTSYNGESGPLDTLINMSFKGTKLYATAWYHPYIGGIVIQLNNQLTNNIPSKKYSVGSCRPADSLSILYYDGYPTSHNGWLQNYNGKWFYFENSYIASHDKWLKRSGKYYYLGPSGELSVGWLLNNGNWYYMNVQGEMTTGWQYINSKYYYFASDGHMLTGRQKINNIYYYFFSDGSMASDQYGDDKQYYDASGKWVPGFQDSCWMNDSKGWWYRFKDGSYPHDTWEKIHGDWYYFYSSGYMATGWLKTGGNWYYLGNDGAMKIGWQKISGMWYYMNTSGKMLTGFQMIGNTLYYFTSNGSMVTGWHYINNNWYYFSGNGSATHGWYKLSNIWYYFDSTGKMLTGWIYPDDHCYYMNPSGAMAVGWIQLNGNWYYMNSSGRMTTGWQHIKNNWYYMDTSGKMLTGLQTINNHLYYLNSSGAMVTGWVYTNYGWYYFTYNGPAFKGWLNVEGNWYYLDPSTGKLYTETWTPDGYYVSSSGAWTGQSR